MPGRNRAWADTRFCGSVIINEGISLTNLLLDAPVTDTLTVVRIVLDLSLGPDVTGGVTDSSNCISVGVGVTSREAMTAGAVPEPDKTDEYPPRGWLYVATKASRQYHQTDTGIAVFLAEFHADLRAMRKVDKGVLFLTMQNIGDIGTKAVQVYGRVRVLCLT